MRAEAAWTHVSSFLGGWFISGVRQVVRLLPLLFLLGGSAVSACSETTGPDGSRCCSESIVRNSGRVGASRRCSDSHSRPPGANCGVTTTCARYLAFDGRPVFPHQSAFPEELRPLLRRCGSGFRAWHATVDLQIEGGSVLPGLDRCFAGYGRRHGTVQSAPPP